MNTRGNNTRQVLKNQLEKLFIEKGFAAVTMSDICESTGMSRGGIYRHYVSTAEAFLDILTQDKDDSAKSLEYAINKGIQAKELFCYFLQEQKKDVLSGKSALSKAIYEFGALHPEHEEFLKKRYEAAVSMIKSILEYGISTGEFKPCDAEAFAQHILLFWEGIKVSSRILCHSETMLDAQIKLLKETVEK